MTRVGFDVSGIDTGWLGGVNYLRNLIKAITSLSNPTIVPVLFAGTTTDLTLLNGLEEIPLVRTSLLDKGGPRWFLRKSQAKAISRDVLFESFLRKHGIDILSHSGDLGARATLPTICWIPDFQHRRLPHFFSKRERGLRDRFYARQCRNATHVVVSSMAAFQDLNRFYPWAIDKTSVLRFAVEPLHRLKASTAAQLKEQFGIRSPFFLVANQFWAHKNHIVIVDALRILRLAGTDVQVMATGPTADYRHPRFFPEFEDYVNKSGVSDLFRVLNTVPYTTLLALLRGCHALINPSKFEGWNTAVEEAKALGKPLILSDIPAHREQAERVASFFAPGDSVHLAKLLLHAWTSPSAGEAPPDDELRRRSEDTFLRFGLEYQAIVRSLCQ